MFKMGFPLSVVLILSSQACKPVRQFEVPASRLRARTLFVGALAPGGSGEVGLEALWGDGKRLDTEAQGEARLQWGQFAYQGQGVAFSRGRLTLSKDHREIPEKGAWIEFWAKEQPNLKTRLEVPVRFDGYFVADFSGSNGFDGSEGKAGRDGASGAAGSSLPNASEPGGRGGNGGNGEPGKDGRDGVRGSEVRVWVTLMPGQAEQLQVKASDGHKTFFYRVDARRGAVLIKADGGNGGEGGRGGKGGRGGSGGLGSPNGKEGRDGYKGPDGAPGRGGDGGSIHVTVDPKAMPFVSSLSFSNRGGVPMGQDGPAPVIVEQAVPSL